jgi:lactate dehydrogenase-like 2-hydroxyacid dehydrogenase
MPPKRDILFIDSTVQVIDTSRRQALKAQFNLLYYDCPSTTEFIQRLQPGGPYSNIVAIVRNGWHKAGPLANHRPFASEIVPHFPSSLKIICCSGHGYDAADVPAITSRGIWYCNTPDTCTEAVANTALFLVLDTFRYLTYAQWCARNDWFASRDLGLKAVDPIGKVVGVVGLGAIGLSVAQKCEAALGTRIHYHGPRRKPQAEQTLRHGAVYHEDLNSLIAATDCLVLACPYTGETHHLLSHTQLTCAKIEGLRVVNIARGQMIDEDALIAALEKGRVVGIGLDVHADEPGINPRFKDDWRVTVLPHIGVCSGTSWENFEKVNLDNLEAFFTTGKPLTPVNDISDSSRID